MRGVVVALVFGTVMLLSGCGSSPTHTDPFVGTWRGTGPGSSPSAGLVIAKTPGGYSATMVSVDVVVSPRVPFFRYGNRLQDFRADRPRPRGLVKWSFVYRGQPGRLIMKYGNGLPATLHRSSIRTAVPAP